MVRATLPTMATTSTRALTLLSVLGTGRLTSAAELAERLDVSERTIRRDVETLRDLGYRVTTVTGVGGGYRLDGSDRLPPLLFDEEQMIAIAVALQTAPTVLTGIADASARALHTVRQAMPAPLRLESEDFTVISVPNYWEFPAAPIEAGVVSDVGAAIRRQEVLRADYSEPRGPGDDSTAVPLRLEPHSMVVWAARWYLVAWDQDASGWRALRLDRLRAKAATRLPFTSRRLPGGNAAAFVRSAVDRGDTLAAWPCQGSAVLAVSPRAAAEFAPGGAVVDYLTESTCRLRMGAWSWTGLAGLYLTFASPLSEVQPVELRRAFADIRNRLQDPAPDEFL